MAYFRELEGLDVAPMQGYIARSKIPFEISQLYDSTKEKKVTDQSLRRSKFRLFKDDALFDLVCAGLVEEVNRSDPSRVYQLVRNDVTHIVYGPGGFFKRHSDYLSVTSNLIQE